MMNLPQWDYGVLKYENVKKDTLEESLLALSVKFIYIFFIRLCFTALLI